MRKFQKGIVVVLLVSLAAVFSAGCGKKEAADPADADKNKALPKLTVATEATFAPFEYRDEKTGDFMGFDMDLIRAIGAVEGFEPEIKDMGFDGIIASVKTGNMDMGMAGLSIDEDRLKEVDFSIPYYKSGLSIAVRKDNDRIKSFNDLKGKKIAVQIGTTGADYAKKIPGAKVTEFDYVTDALLEVKNGGADALVNDYPVSIYYINKSGKDFKIVGDLLQSEFYGIAIKKENTELQKKINDGLNKLKANGDYAKLYKKWFNEEPPEYLPGEPAK